MGVGRVELAYAARRLEDVWLSLYSLRERE